MPPIAHAPTLPPIPGVSLPMTRAIQRTVVYAQLMLPMYSGLASEPCQHSLDTLTAPLPARPAHYAHRLALSLLRHGADERTVILTLLHLVEDVLTDKLMAPGVPVAPASLVSPVGLP